MAHHGFEDIPEGNTASEPLNEELHWDKATRGGSIKERDRVAQPEDPDDWDLYTVGSSPTGDDWSTFTPGDFALYFPGSGWQTRTPWAGAGPLWDENTSEFVQFNGTNWRELTNTAPS